MPPVKVGSDQLYRPKTAEAARAAVREMAAHSPNLIKIWVDDGLGKYPKMLPEAYEAVIDEAHRANLKVAAHVYYLSDAKSLVQHGVDILAHSIRDRELDAETVSLLKSKNVFYIPTLQLEESFYVYGGQPEWMNTPFFKTAVTPKQMELLNSEAKATGLDVHRKAFETAMANAKKLHTATVSMGMGTDSGANPYRIQGFAEHRELELMVEAGFSPLEAIHAATQVNAKMLGIEDKTGTVEKGKQADMVILDANPLDDIRDTRKISAVYHRGRKVEPKLQD
jgi:imidazolonepropionase-like amidohydrolase